MVTDVKREAVVVFDVKVALICVPWGGDVKVALIC